MSNWNGGVQGYLCGCANTQVYAPGVPALVAGDGPVSQPLDLSIQIQASDAAPLYLIVDGEETTQLSLPYQVQDGDAIGPVGVIDGPSQTQLLISASVPSSLGPTAYLEQFGELELSLGDTYGDAPWSVAIYCNSIAGPGNTDILVSAGTYEELSIQKFLNLIPFPVLWWAPYNISANILLSNDRRTIESAGPVGGLGAAMSYTGRAFGKYYAEALLGNLERAAFGLTYNFDYSVYVGANAASWGVMAVRNGDVTTLTPFFQGIAGTAQSGSPVALCVAADMDQGLVWLGYLDSDFRAAWLGGGDPAAGVSPTFDMGITGNVMWLAGSVQGMGSSLTLQNHRREFSGVIPAGFLPWG